MKAIENRISISDEIFNDEYEYMFGGKKNERVYFHYIHIKKESNNKGIAMNYTEALRFARYRREDGRYKNFEFLINLYE